MCLGLCYLWFGALKFFPALSPAECLAEATVAKMTLGWIEGRLACNLLATMEVAIGLALIIGFRLRWAVLAVMAHMACTLMPIVLLPDQFFGTAPFGLTLVGQYIVKNIVFIAVAFFIYKVETNSFSGLERQKVEN
jgi:uncharacterized membrane protein YkgB